MLATLNQLEFESAAMIAILDKENRPVAIKNYLADQGTDLESQMVMLIYNCLDVVDQQYARVKTKQEHD